MAAALRWKRSKSFDYPKIWHTFEAKDINSDRFVEYFIADLPYSQHDEALKLLIEQFCKEEPMCEAYGRQFTHSSLYRRLFLENHNFSGYADDSVAVQDFVQYWKPIFQQNAVLACYRRASDEIVGLNMNYVTFNDEHYIDRIMPQVQNRFFFAQLFYVSNFLLPQNQNQTQCFIFVSVFSRSYRLRLV